MNYDFLESGRYECEEKEVYSDSDYHEVAQKLDSASEWFEEVVEILYGSRKLSRDRLENALDELGHSLGKKLPKRDNMKNILNEWVEANIKYLTTI